MAEIKQTKTVEEIKDTIKSSMLWEKSVHFSHRKSTKSFNITYYYYLFGSTLLIIEHMKVCKIYIMACVTKCYTNFNVKHTYYSDICFSCACVRFINFHILHDTHALGLQFTLPFVVHSTFCVSYLYIYKRKKHAILNCFITKRFRLPTRQVVSTSLLSS